jgi:hypothetical protein
MSTGNVAKQNGGNAADQLAGGVAQEISRPAQGMENLDPVLIYGVLKKYIGLDKNAPVYNPKTGKQEAKPLSRYNPEAKKMY